MGILYPAQEPVIISRRAGRGVRIVKKHRLVCDCIKEILYNSLGVVINIEAGDFGSAGGLHFNCLRSAVCIAGENEAVSALIGYTGKESAGICRGVLFVLLCEGIPGLI